MNFDVMKDFLTRETTPALLSEALDELIFDFTTVYGRSEDVLPRSVFADHINTIKDLRDLFAVM